MLAATSSHALYSSRIIKAGALLSDTRMVLENWDVGASLSDNLSRIHETNLLGKASRSRVSDVLAAFRRRYFGDPQLLQALAILAKGPISGDTLDRILYFQAA